MSEPVLIGIPYSPWTRRTVQALQRMDVPFRQQLYTPVLSEPGLRWQLGRWRGPVTVPVLVRADGPPLTDSLDIVAWASDRSAKPLAPEPLRPAIREWNARAEAALCAGRQRTALAALDDPDALRASLPPAIRRLGPLGMLIGRDATQRLFDKYGDARTPPAWREDLEHYVAHLDHVLAERGEHVLGEPSYADLVAASGLSFIAPHRTAHVPEAARHCWTIPELVQRHPRVFAWRDRLLD